MPIATLTSKGQITMPRVVRESLGLQAGDKVDFVPDEAGGYHVVPVRTDIGALLGRLAGRVTRPVSIARMNESVREAALERDRDTRSRPTTKGPRSARVKR